MISVGIRGAGVAGLSFAEALLTHVPGVSVSVFDLRPRLPHPARTFCFFRDQQRDTPLPLTHQWSSVAFAGPNFRRTIACPKSPYALVRGDDIFNQLLSRLEEAKVSFHWGCDEVEASSRTITADGITKRFDLVVDAAFTPSESSATLWQSFAGLWVSAERPIFDSETALLMDLDVGELNASVRFVYLLPTSSTTALIEHTVFARQPLSREEHLAACHEWARRQEYTGLTIVDTEYGRIPMGLVRPNESQTIPRIGTAGGAVRASTGYAFQTTLRQVNQLAIAIATALKKGGNLPALTQPPLPTWMRVSDQLFIKALANAPEQGQEMMNELLRKAPEVELLSFLAGTASWREALRVMGCVPKFRMVSALVGRGWRQRGDSDRSRKQ
jgi:lycopene beta-cyclase